jgi:creatinine amidohydrolase/Fe(II)-dependent formamide hydrolase-like protein
LKNWSILAMRNLNKYEELFPDEFSKILKEKPIIYCTFGPMEYHGRHCALGIDPGKGYEICLRAADISGGIVFPIIPIAPNGYSMHKSENRDELRKISKFMPFSVFTSINICEKLYYEILENFAEDIGFKVCVIMGSHGPAGVLAEKIAKENPILKGMHIINTGSLSHNQDLIDLEYKRLKIPRISHGGMWESTMYLACNAELIDSEKIHKFPPGPYENYMTTTFGPNRTPDHEEISKVSVEFGEKLIQTAAERIAKDAISVLKKIQE